MRHIQPNYAFMLVWSIFGLIHWRLLFFVKEVTLLERSSEILRKFVFLNNFEKGKTKRKIWICLNKCFWSEQENGTNINKNWFSPQNNPHTAKLCFLVGLKHFCANLLKTSLFSQNWRTQKEAQKKIESFFFTTGLKSGKTRGKLGFILNNPFVQSSKTGQILIKNVFLYKKWATYS